MYCVMTSPVSGARPVGDQLNKQTNCRLVGGRFVGCRTVLLKLVIFDSNTCHNCVKLLMFLVSGTRLQRLG